MDKKIQQYLEKIVLVFFDDILVFSNTQEVHLGHLRKIFNYYKQKIMC